MFRTQFPILSKTWMRLSGRSQTYTRLSLPRMTQCGWPPPVAPNVPFGQSVPLWPQLEPHWRR